MHNFLRMTIAVGTVAVGLATPTSAVHAAAEPGTGHAEMSWTVTDGSGAPPPDSFGPDGDGSWGGADRVWTQKGFTGSYRIVVDGVSVAGYCGDFHNAQSPDAASTWVADRTAFAGSDKALTKLSYVQWRWGATTDSDTAAAVNLYTHFLGSPDDRSNGRGVPVPDIDDDDVLDEIVTVLVPHEAVGFLMTAMDTEAEAWSNAFGHRSADVSNGIAVTVTGDDVVVTSTVTGTSLPAGSFDVRRDSAGTTVTTAGVAVPLRDATNGSQNSIVAGAPQSFSAPAAPVADVHLRKTVSSTSRPEWVNAQRNTSPSHTPATAPLVASDGSHDDATADADDAVPVFTAGDLVSFTYEVWLDPSSTGSVGWPKGTTDVVADDAGTTDVTDDDFVPPYVEGDDGDGVLEQGETWVYQAVDQRTAQPGERYTNIATVGPGQVVDAATGTPSASSTNVRTDRAGYVVPCVTTSASDQADGDRLVGPGGGVIVDVVTYCNLVPGQEYVVEGVAVAHDSAEATEYRGTTAFTPTSPDGSVAVEIVVSPEEAGIVDPGRYVVFETISVAGPGDDRRVVAEHADIDDEAQSFTVRRPLEVTTTACENTVALSSDEATVMSVTTAAICDRVVVTGDPGDEVEVTVTPYPVMGDQRVCLEPGPASTTRLTLDTDGRGEWETPRVDVPADSWEFIETVVSTGENDDRHAGRECATSASEPAETVVVSAPPPVETVTVPTTSTTAPPVPAIVVRTPELPRTGNDASDWLQRLGSFVLLAGVAIVVAVGWNLPLRERPTT